MMGRTSERDPGELFFTEKRLVDQLSHLVPQIHLTLVSILQSVALAFLLASVRGPTSNTLGAFWPALLIHHFYLPHIVSFFAIIIAWNENAYATLFLHWPLTALSTSLQFLLAVVEIAAFTNVDNVGVWTIWIGFTALLGAYIHLRDVSVTSDNLYPYGSATERIVGWNDVAYWGLSSLVVLGFLRTFAVGPFPFALSLLGSEHFVLFDNVVPLLVLGATLYIMRQDDGYYAGYISQVFERAHSIYQIEKNGRISPKKLTSQKSQSEG